MIPYRIEERHKVVYPLMHALSTGKLVLCSSLGPVAHLARAPLLQSGGKRFKSARVHRSLDIYLTRFFLGILNDKIADPCDDWILILRIARSDLF